MIVNTARVKKSSLLLSNLRVCPVDILLPFSEGGRILPL
jgi:hypothetical protein